LIRSAYFTAPTQIARAVAAAGPVGAVLPGACWCAAIAQWAAEAEHARATCGPAPHATTFGRVPTAAAPDIMAERYRNLALL